MNKTKKIIITALLLIAPATVFSQETNIDLSSIDLKYISSCSDSDQICLEQKKAVIALIKKVLVRLQADLAEAKEIRDKQENHEKDDRTYFIKSNLELGGASSDSFDKKAKIVWEIFTDISPDEYIEDYIKNFRLYYDEEDFFSAYVRLSSDTYPKWELAVNLDQVNLSNKKSVDSLTDTLIHEFAHILTLNSGEIDEKKDEDSCLEYYAEEGCFDEESYMNIFIDQFWSKKDLKEHIDDVRHIEDAEEREEAVVDFYEDRDDEFVSEYAATNPEEDIAESFSYFILEGPQAVETKADEKINFFYSFDELVNLREHIRETIL